MTITQTKRVVDFVVNARFEDIPKKAVSVASEAILDCIGVALAGARQSAGEIAAKWARAAGGAPQATVWGRGFKTSAHDAALVNGTAGHALDYDDVTWGLIGHPSVSLVPSLIALAELTGASGQELLLAYVVGFEVMAKLGRTTQPKHSLEGGWHATSTIGSFGSTAACCKLLGLDAQQTGNALGIVYSMTSGNVSNFGTMTKPLHAGLAARNGVQAAQLSELGFTATSHPFDGARSFQEVYSRGFPYTFEPLEELGSEYELVVRGVVIKPYPCGVAIHPAIDAALELREQEGLQVGDIERIEIGVTRYTYDKLSYHAPQTGLEGKFSMEYAVARALMDNRVTTETFTDQAVQAPAAQRLLRRITMYVDEEIESTWKMGSRPVRVQIWLQSGRMIAKRVDISRGNPEVPLNHQELGAKFADCARQSLGSQAMQSALNVLKNLSSLREITELTKALAGTWGVPDQE
jgi:2-methylcitrate dehydratase PrpD